MTGDAFEQAARAVAAGQGAGSVPQSLRDFRDRYVGTTAIAALSVPGLAHRIAQSAIFGAVQLVLLSDLAVQAAPSLRVERRGGLVWLEGEQVDDVIRAVFHVLSEELGGGGRAAGALGVGERVRGPGGECYGLVVDQLRTAARLAREGELVLAPEVPQAAVPEGVGVFEAPAKLSERVGFPARLLRDYR